jgi:hypothetical protein
LLWIESLREVDSLWTPFVSDSFFHPFPFALATRHIYFPVSIAIGRAPERAGNILARRRPWGGRWCSFPQRVYAGTPSAIKWEIAMSSTAEGLRSVRHSAVLKSDYRYRPRKPALALQRSIRSPDPPAWQTELRQRRSPQVTVTLPKLGSK